MYFITHNMGNGSGGVKAVAVGPTSREVGTTGYALRERIAAHRRAGVSGMSR